MRRAWLLSAKRRGFVADRHPDATMAVSTYQFDLSHGSAVVWPEARHGRAESSLIRATVLAATRAARCIEAERGFRH